MDEYLKKFNKTVNKLKGRVDLPSLLIHKLVDQDNVLLWRYLEKLSGFHSNLERMRYVYRDLVRFEIYPPFQKDEKSDELAVTKREEGNVYYGLEKYREALDCYTNSILVAKSSRLAALAYANRSAVLSKLGLHRECLMEIDRALKEDYPENLKPKLQARQKHSKAQKISREKQYEPVPEISESEKHPQIASARNCVKIRKNQKYGRLVVATRKIQIGEILAVDSAYAGVVHDELFYVYCQECFQLCYNLIPCDKCTKALYCSENCKSEAFNTYHKYECPILLSLDLLQIDTPKKLALRIVLKAKNELDTHSDDLDGIYRSDRFKEVSSMLTHVEKRSGQNILTRTALSCGLFDLIKKHTTFLEDGASEDGLMEALLSVSLICGTNTVGVNELSPTKMGAYELNIFVTALYPFFTLFNHSCFPNVSRQYHGSKMVIRAINTIKRGEQCFVEYGPNYLFHNKEFRQTFLTDYQFFTCTCLACKGDWPVRAGLFKRVDWLVDEALTMMKFRTADVAVAKKELARLLEKTKKAERIVPLGHEYIYRHLLLFCYDIFGNKRRF